MTSMANTKLMLSSEPTRWAHYMHLLGWATHRTDLYARLKGVEEQEFDTKEEPVETVTTAVEPSTGEKRSRTDEEEDEPKSLPAQNRLAHQEEVVQKTLQEKWASWCCLVNHGTCVVL